MNDEYTHENQKEIETVARFGDHIHIKDLTFVQKGSPQASVRAHFLVDGIFRIFVFKVKSACAHRQSPTTVSINATDRELGAGWWAHSSQNASDLVRDSEMDWANEDGEIQEEGARGNVDAQSCCALRNDVHCRMCAGRQCDMRTSWKNELIERSQNEIVTGESLT